MITFEQPSNEFNRLLLQKKLPWTISGQYFNDVKLLLAQLKSPLTILGQPFNDSNLFPLQLNEPFTSLNLTAIFFRFLLLKST